MMWRLVPLMLGATVACCTPRQRTTLHPRAEEVSVDGSLVLRTLPDGAVEVLVRRTLGDLSAHAAIRLRRSTAQNARTSPHLHFAGARAWQALAALPGLSADARYVAARNGVDELGGRYRVRKIIDDTSNSLLLAREEAKDPRTLDAAGKRVRRVLATRLRLYAQGFVHEVQ